MKKKFIEYTGEKNNFKTITLCNCLINYAKEYIQETNINVTKEVRDAILVDFINYLGVQGWIDLALYTKGLYDGRIREGKIEPNILITNLLNHGSYYLFKYNPTESIIRNNYMNECKEKVSLNECKKVVVDFINYIAKVNNIDNLEELKTYIETSAAYAVIFEKSETLIRKLKYTSNK